MTSTKQPPAITITENPKSYDIIITPSQTSLNMTQYKSLLAPLNPHTQNNTFRIHPYQYPYLIQLLHLKNIPYHTTLNPPQPLPDIISLKHQLRSYQQQLLNKWLQHKKGILILPTGAGKTLLGLAAIVSTKSPTLILVPTLVLLEQWKNEVLTALTNAGTLLGELSGNKKLIKPITIATYDSARLHVRKIKNQYTLIIADECHHAMSPGNLQTLKGLTAPYRLGLTATPPLDPVPLEPLLGSLITQKHTQVKALQQQGYLATYKIKTIKIPLTPQEQEQYDQYRKIYLSYLRKNNIILKHAHDFEQQLLYRVNKDPQAYEALIAHRKAIKIAFATPQKIYYLQTLLNTHKNDQTIIFSEHNQTAIEIAETYLLPLIIHETPTYEREYYLSWFRQGKLKTLVTGKVLDEGWNVTNANVGIIISGTSQQRQFIQRLGRLLRPKGGGDPAILYELITLNTTEERTSKRRKKGL